MTSPEAPGRGRIYNSILDTIGNTPIIRLGKLAADEGVKADLLAKLEFFNPIASVKDRIGLAMIEAIEANDIRPVIDSHFALENLADAFRHPIRLKRHDCYCLFDSYPEQLASSMVMLLEMAAADDALVFGAHLIFLSIIRIAKSNDDYHCLPSP